MKRSFFRQNKVADVVDTTDAADSLLNTCDEVLGQFQVLEAASDLETCEDGIGGKIGGVLSASQVDACWIERHERISIEQVGKWPITGMILPVAIDATDSMRFRVLWDQAQDRAEWLQNVERQRKENEMNARPPFQDVPEGPFNCVIASVEPTGVTDDEGKVELVFYLTIRNPDDTTVCVRVTKNVPPLSLRRFYPGKLMLVVAQPDKGGTLAFIFKDD
ncbi:MAG: hypothetical protein FWH11_06400 [Micrococcales bacterium]|nr:hypothetical protein [Micrococcales bacterium]